MQGSPALPVPRRHSIPVGKIGIGAALAVIIGVIVAVSQSGGPLTPPVAPVQQPATRPLVEARGKIVPVRWAKVTALLGGRVTAVSADEGAQLVERQEIVRLDTGESAVNVVAPFRGTLASLSVRFGETVLPGGEIGHIGDLTRFRIETTDLDEFSVSRVSIGQPVTVFFDSLEGVEAQGRVVSIALMGRTGSAGDVTFPVTIDFDPPAGALRWGMTVRLHFK